MKCSKRRGCTEGWKRQCLCQEGKTKRTSVSLGWMAGCYPWCILENFITFMRTCLVELINDHSYFLSLPNAGVSSAILNRNKSIP
jgi:hypothetical protein